MLRASLRHPQLRLTRKTVAGVQRSGRCGRMPIAVLACLDVVVLVHAVRWWCSAGSGPPAGLAPYGATLLVR